MPTATPFTALGRGNGFPFCPTKVDVSNFDYWITLGGFKKTDGGSPTQAQIDLSLSNAAKIYWNIYGVTGEATSSLASVTFVNMDEAESSTVSFAKTPSPSDTEEREPIDRACWTSWGLVKRGVAADIAEGLGFDGGITESLGVGGGIVRMYDGTTANEENFVGYGASSLASATEEDPIVVLYSHVYVSSYEDVFGFFSAEGAYTTLSGIPVACVVDGPSESGLDAANLTSTYTVGSQTYTVRIDSLDFYTYT